MAVLTGTKWGDPTLGTSGGVVTWSIAPAGLAVSAFDTIEEVSGEFSVNPDSFLTFDYEARMREAFDAWSTYGDIEFVQIADGGGAAGEGAVADIRVFFAEGGTKFDGLAFFPPPNAGPRAGDVLIDTIDRFNTDQDYFYALFAHELGHSLGLNHVPGVALLNPGIIVRDLQADDIQGIQQIYGAQDDAPTVFTLAATDVDIDVLGAPRELTVRGNAGGNRIDGTVGVQTLLGQSGDDRLFGRGGADELFGSQGDDLLIGGNGKDEAFGGTGSDLLRGGAGQDTLFGGGLSDEARGGSGNDTVFGGIDDDLLYGGADADSLSGGNGADILHGQAGGDSINGDNGADLIYGGNGRDALAGGTGNDTLLGQAGRDSLSGGDGVDFLDGGGGNDVLAGGTGADFFAFGLSGGNDRITDFEADRDFIDLTELQLSQRALKQALPTALTATEQGAAILDLTLLGGAGSVRIRGIDPDDIDGALFLL